VVQFVLLCFFSEIKKKLGADTWPINIDETVMNVFKHFSTEGLYLYN